MSILANLLNRLAMATALPTPSDWWILAATFLVYSAIALPLGFSMNFLKWNPIDFHPLRLLGAMIWLFITPALLEETLFRVLLIPPPTEALSPLIWLFWAAFSLILFIISHPIAALTYNRAGNPTFCQTPFLSLATILGLACTIAYTLTGSLLIPVLFHWLVVVVWLFLLDGEHKLSANLQAKSDNLTPSS
ncbi:CPBP family glutamic-type intramembrane protease [Arthrospira platensis]|jgi:predicted Abi (CAAX) family protease|uniref:CAAX prenyl protease 2/Lysostaphin resistance protein A-like domain-containing protein n=1 Tax=Limnospira platensis NIES-46 TaxID=1236695 RepID=A0A5M3T787_LIMPL|nr:CPBP family glutamic-type intramembrane protease [Arthrospira platensis]AMW26646.1 abortive infection protein [Arthrospira platensis YZ]KDR57928.1 abortive infection protein [Arthrospira platensis str. Paraca]MBD2667538.1 CPBP family intramembrane metalloprotease [Arthrospira platensis FACHB-439]MBD2709709.1 CPBP family intramembrane metalloprotease [Arthrospira platensis FACHB-835]MDF2209043.1 CPBP family glutamic-type intramembrane protease [Arthrospira platensis NCB002]MDT9181158.1 CPBP